MFQLVLTRLLEGLDRRQKMQCINDFMCYEINCSWSSISTLMTMSLINRLVRQQKCENDFASLLLRLITSAFCNCLITVVLKKMLSRSFQIKNFNSVEMLFNFGLISRHFFIAPPRKNTSPWSRFLNSN